MSDVDSNGVDWLDRFHAYSERFKQSSVAGEVYLDTLEHIKRVRNERDEARRELCMIMGGKGGRSSQISPDAIEYAKSRGWDCFKDGDIQRQKILDEIKAAEMTKNDALDRLAKLDEELGLL